MEGSRRMELMAPQQPKHTEKSPTKVAKLAVRFEVQLEESTDEKCAEVSYARLLWKHEMKRKRASNSLSKSVSNLNQQQLSDDPFGDDNSQNIEALAKRMEEKYGKSYVTKSRSKYEDLGDGYDTDDSFIDNEEAYDEVVPSTLTTEHGGFYINCGVLDFKEISDDEIVEEAAAKKKLKVNKKKRVLSGSEEKHSIKKKKTLSSSKPIDKSKKLLIKKKLMKSGGSSSDKEKLLLKRKKLLQKKKKLVAKAGLDLTDNELNNKALQYDSIIDDVIKRGIISPGGQSRTTSNLQSPPPQPDNSTFQTVSTADTSDTSKIREAKDPPKLPENLPEACTARITELQKMAESSTNEKGKFFTNQVNQLLISLDNEVRVLSSANNRNAVYSFLSTFLPINRETLMKRMKLLRQKELSSKLEEPLRTLKDAIAESMPAQIEKYNADIAIKQQGKQEDFEKLKEDSQGSEDEGSRPTTPSLTQPPGSESPSQGGAIHNGEKKKEKAAYNTLRKKFEWTEKIRKCLCDVVSIRMDSYEILKGKGQTAEEYLKEFLENEVRVLWPKGWMQSRVLYKESKPAHVKWTNPNQVPVKQASQPKKPTLIANAMKMAATINNAKKTTPTMTTSSGSTSTSSLAKAAIDSHKPGIVDGMFKAITVTCNTVPNINKPVSASALLNATAKPTTKESSKMTTVITASDILSKDKTVASTTANLLTTLTAGATVTTTENGEKVVMDGNKIIGRLVPTTNKTAALGSKKPVTVSASIIDPTSPPHQVSHVADVKPTIIDLNDHELLNSPTGSHVTTSQDSLNSLTGSPLITASTSKIMSGNSTNEAKKADLAELQAVKKRQLLVKQQKMAAQSKQAAAHVVLQTAQALQQQHIAASIANQQAMLRHKKMADNLNEQTKIAKQQRIAAIVNEQKIAANIAAQQRMAQQRQIAQAQQHQAEQSQAQKQQIRQKLIEQQKHQQHLAPGPVMTSPPSTLAHSALSLVGSTSPATAAKTYSKSKAAHTSPVADHRASTSAVVYSSPAHCINRSPVMTSSPGLNSLSPAIVAAASMNSLCAHPVMTVPHTNRGLSLPYRLPMTAAAAAAAAAGFPPGFTSTSPSTGAAVPHSGSPLVIPTSAWPPALTQPNYSPAQIAAEYRRSIDARTKLENMSKKRPM